MVINKFGDRLYTGLVNTMREHLTGIAAKVEATQGDSFLRELKLRWDHHNKSMQMIRDILMVRRNASRVFEENFFLAIVGLWLFDLARQLNQYHKMRSRLRCTLSPQAHFETVACSQCAVSCPMGNTRCLTYAHASLDPEPALTF